MTTASARRTALILDLRRAVQPGVKRRAWVYGIGCLVVSVTP